MNTAKPSLELRAKIHLEALHHQARRKDHEMCKLLLSLIKAKVPVRLYSTSLSQINIPISFALEWIS